MKITLTIKCLWRSQSPSCKAQCAKSLMWGDFVTKPRQCKWTEGTKEGKVHGTWDTLSHFQYILQLPGKRGLVFTSPDCRRGLEAWAPTLGEGSDSSCEPVLIWRSSRHIEKHFMSRLWTALTFPGLSLGLSSEGTLACGTDISTRRCLGSSNSRLSWAFCPVPASTLAARLLPLVSSASFCPRL